MSKKFYERASEAELDLLYEVMGQYHGHLGQHEIKVALVMARKFDKDDEPIPCVKFAGGFAAAVTRIIPMKRRVFDEHEIEIETDGLVWDHLSDASRRALMDHELNHVRLVLDRNGIVKQDDRGRPKLKLIADDWIMTGFYDIIRRHGNDALEWQSVSRVYQTAQEAHHYHQAATTPAEAVAA